MKMPLALGALALPLALLAGSAQAQDDPLKSPACGAALARLQAARSSGGNVQGLRDLAASTCLGSAALPTRPARVLQPPLSVPAPQIDVPASVSPLASVPPVSLPPPPLAIQRAPGPATCDAGGCWVDGAGGHLQHVPPTLVGPSGLCTQQGGLVYCP